MPDEIPIVPPVVTDPPKPADPPAPKPAAPAAAPDWMENRVTRERRKTLKQLGIKVSKDATELEIDKAIEEHKTKATTRKELLQAETAARESAEKKNADLQGQIEALKIYADLEMSRLSPEHQALVTKVAGKDPADQLKQIAVLRTMQEKPEEKEKPIAPPADTRGKGAPAPPPPKAEGDVNKQFAAIKAMPRATPKDAAKRAVAFAIFAVDHGDEILAGYTLE